MNKNTQFLTSTFVDDTLTERHSIKLKKYKKETVQTSTAQSTCAPQDTFSHAGIVWHFSRITLSKSRQP